MIKKLGLFGACILVALALVAAPHVAGPVTMEEKVDTDDVVRESIITGGFLIGLLVCLSMIKLAEQKRAWQLLAGGFGILALGGIFDVADEFWDINYFDLGSKVWLLAGVALLAVGFYFMLKVKKK